MFGAIIGLDPLFPQEMYNWNPELSEPFFATRYSDIQGILVICIRACILRVIRTVGIGGLIEIDYHPVHPYLFHF